MRGEETGLDFVEGIWAKFSASLHPIPRISGGRTIGVCYNGGAPEGYTTCSVGAEIESDKESNRFDSWWLPVRECVVCGFEAEGFERLTGSALNKAMKCTRFWLKKHGLIADGFFPEMYYDSSPALAYMELWIPFRQRENK